MKSANVKSFTRFDNDIWQEGESEKKSEFKAGQEFRRHPDHVLGQIPNFQLKQYQIMI